jgi:hypothetical protein
LRVRLWRVTKAPIAETFDSGDVHPLGAKLGQLFDLLESSLSVASSFFISK